MKGLLTRNYNKHYMGIAGNPKSRRYVYNHGITGESYHLLRAERNRCIVIENYFSVLNGRYGSRPIFRTHSNKVVVSLFYYTESKDEALNVNTINNLGDVLSEILGLPVELRITKLLYPYLDREIFAKFIRGKTEVRGSRQLLKWAMSALPVYKDVPTRHIPRDYKSSTIVLGLKVIISGRLVTERAKPRDTVSSKEVGSFKLQVGSVVDYGSYTTKNRLGSVTVKVWINQKLIV